MRKNIAVLILMVLFSFFYAACEKESTTPKDQPNTFSPSLTLNVNGDSLNFQNPQVLIKKRSGSTFSQEIKGEIIVGQSVNKAFSIWYSGDLNANFSPYSMLYYENDYQINWSLFSDSLPVYILSNHHQRVSGYADPVTLTGDSGRITISAIQFRNLPVQVYNL